MQLDLFGEVEAAEDAAAQLAADRAEWADSFDRATWTPPEGSSLGPQLGWVCPDPECRKVEWGTYQLSINHGWDPTIPGRAPFDGRCHRLRLLASQARAEKVRQERMATNAR